MALHQQRNLQSDPRSREDLISDHAIEAALHEPADHRKLVVSDHHKHMFRFRCHAWKRLHVSANPQILAAPSPRSLWQFLTIHLRCNRRNHRYRCSCRVDSSMDSIRPSDVSEEQNRSHCIPLTPACSHCNWLLPSTSLRRLLQLTERRRRGFV